MIEKGELATSVKEKKVKTKFIDLDHAGNDKLLNQLLLSLGCWLMLERMFCVDTAWDIDCDYDIKWRKHLLV